MNISNNTAHSTEPIASTTITSPTLQNASNRSIWIGVYSDQLTKIYGANAEWLAQLPASLKRNNPAESLRALAEKMTEGLITGRANKDTDAIKRTCRLIGIKPTYKAITAFLTASNHTPEPAATHGP
jgi:hypothetical protein